MSRAFIASVLGLAGVLAYLVAAVTLADAIPRWWPVEVVYFLIAGTVWVIPVRWLMIWAAHKDAAGGSSDRHQTGMGP